MPATTRCRRRCRPCHHPASCPEARISSPRRCHHMCRDRTTWEVRQVSDWPPSGARRVLARKNPPRPVLDPPRRSDLPSVGFASQALPQRPEARGRNLNWLLIFIPIEVVLDYTMAARLLLVVLAVGHWGRTAA